MFCCLSITIIGLVLLYEIGNYLYKFGGSFDENGNTQQLRGMYIEGIVDEIFTNIYNGVIGSSIEGKTYGYFTIMCIKSPDPSSNGKYNYGDDNPYNCDIYDGYQQWWIRKIQRSGGSIPKYIQSEQIKTQVIEKLQTTFPDSNITKGNANCCDQYRITW